MCTEHNDQLCPYSSHEHIYSERDDELAGAVALIASLTGGLPDANSSIEGALIVEGGVGSNYGCHFVNETFALRDYCWCDGRIHPLLADGSPGCPPNFEHFDSGIKGSWYKHIGRDMAFNRATKHPHEAYAVLRHCAAKLPTPTVTRGALGWEVAP